jgi:8-oxo-dGTP diphosphatase
MTRRDPTQSPEIIDVAAGLIFRGGNVLITQRRPGDHLAGLWEFPGGKRESYESFEDCLRREFLEELGIRVEPLELLGAVIHAYPEKTVHLKFFHCACPEAEPTQLGCHAIAWVGLTELRKYEFPAADLRMIELLENRLDLWGAG